jgi:small subunit ribosomal protein S2
VIADAVAAGLQARSAQVAKEDAAAAKAGEESVAAGEPLADWEKELLTSNAEADAATPKAGE